MELSGEVDLPLMPFMRYVVEALRDNEDIAKALSDKVLCVIVAQAFEKALRGVAS